MSKAQETRQEYLAKLEALTADRTKMIEEKVEAYRLALEASTPIDNAEIDKIKRIIAALDEVIAAEEEAAKKYEELMNPQPVDDIPQDDEEIVVEENPIEEAPVEEAEEKVEEIVEEEAPAVAEDAIPFEKVEDTNVETEENFQEEIIKVLNIDRPTTITISRNNARR